MIPGVGLRPHFWKNTFVGKRIPLFTKLPEPRREAERLTIMMQLTIEEIKMQDRRRAAIHESGHLTVAVALGIDARAWVYENKGCDVWESHTWLGRMEATRHPPSVAVAGVVAECWAKDPEVDCWNIGEFIRLDVITPSPTDLVNFPADEKLEETIEESLVLLVKYKKFFDWAVARLVEDEGITNGEARDQFDEFDGRLPAWKLAQLSA